jgi:hypothetical protein
VRSSDGGFFSDGLRRSARKLAPSTQSVRTLPRSPPVVSALPRRTPLIPPAEAPETMSIVAATFARFSSSVYAFVSSPRLARTRRQSS